MNAGLLGVPAYDYDGRPLSLSERQSLAVEGQGGTNYAPGSPEFEFMTAPSVGLGSAQQSTNPIHRLEDFFNDTLGLGNVPLPDRVTQPGQGLIADVLPGYDGLFNNAAVILVGIALLILAFFLVPQIRSKFQ